MAHYEWTAMWLRQGKWEAVGLRGSKEFALNEMNEWRKDLPNAVLGIARRPVPEWELIEVSFREGLRDHMLRGWRP